MYYDKKCNANGCHRRGHHQIFRFANNVRCTSFKTKCLKICLEIVHWLLSYVLRRWRRAKYHFNNLPDLTYRHNVVRTRVVCNQFSASSMNHTKFDVFTANFTYTSRWNLDIYGQCFVSTLKTWFCLIFNRPAVSEEKIILGYIICYGRFHGRIRYDKR